MCNHGLHSIRDVIIRGVAAELVMTKMEDSGVLDAVALPISLVVHIFGDTRGDDDTVHLDANAEGTIFYVQGYQGTT